MTGHAHTSPNLACTITCDQHLAGRHHPVLWALCWHQAICSISSSSSSRSSTLRQLIQLLRLAPSQPARNLVVVVWSASVWVGQLHPEGSYKEAELTIQGVIIFPVTYRQDGAVWRGRVLAILG